MARQELLYRGRLDIGDGTPRPLEVWHVDDVAVVFEGGAVIARATGVTVGWTDDDRLLVTGVSPEGADVQWVGPDPNRPAGSWSDHRVRWADGTVWAKATIVWSQYGVQVKRVGEATAKLAGATTLVEGGRRYIVHGAVRHALESTSSGCGCGK